MPQRAVRAYPRQPVGEGAGEQLAVKELPRVRPQLRHGRALEAPVERAQKVPPVTSVQSQQPGSPPDELGHEARPLRGREVAAGEPGVGVDDVRGEQRVLQVEHSEMPIGRQDGSPLPFGPLVHDRLAGFRPHAGVLEHRGKVHVVDVVVPVDDTGIEGEVHPVVAVARVPQLEEVVDPVARVGLGVGAVQRDVSEGPLGHHVSILDLGSQLRLLPPDRQGSDHPFRDRHGRVGALELPLHPPAAGEGPVRHVDGLPAVVVERVLPEEVLAELHQPAVAQRVPHARRDVVHLRPSSFWPARRHGEDGRDDHVHRDDVDDALRARPGTHATGRARTR